MALPFVFGGLIVSGSGSCWARIRPYGRHRCRSNVAIAAPMALTPFRPARHIAGPVSRPAMDRDARGGALVSGLAATRAGGTGEWALLVRHSCRSIWLSARRPAHGAGGGVVGRRVGGLVVGAHQREVPLDGAIRALAAGFTRRPGSRLCGRPGQGPLAYWLRSHEQPDAGALQRALIGLYAVAAARCASSG